MSEKAIKAGPGLIYFWKFELTGND